MNELLIIGLDKVALLNLSKIKDESDNCATREFLSDVFYEFEYWPISVLRDFWLIRRVNRMRITNFCFGNGMSPYAFENIMSFYHNKTSENQHRFKEMKDLWKRLEKQLPSNYYYYSMELKNEIYFDNRLRRSGQPVQMQTTENMYNQQNPCATDDYYFENIYNLTYNVQINIVRLQEEKYEYRKNILKRAKEKKDFELAAVKCMEEKKRAGRKKNKTCITIFKIKFNT